VTSLGPDHAVDLGVFRLMAEALPHLVWFARSDGTVMFYNRRAELYDGLAAGPDGAYDWAPIVHPDDLDATEQAWRRAVESGLEYECEHRVRMADGTFRWHISRALPVDTDADTMWFGTATDTQLLAETREALADSEARLRSVFSAIDQGYCLCELVFDRAGEPVDYRFLETNPLFEEATGLHGAVGRTAFELVPSLEPHWLETYSQVALGSRPVRFQQESPAMGRRFDVFATPVAPRGRFALVFSDITERYAALAALQESEQRFRNMADHAPVMIWVTDADGSCTYLNRRWYEFTGQSEDDALGRGWLDATHPDDRSEAERAFADANRRQVSFSLDYRLRRHDGSYRWAVDAAAPRFSDDGRFLGFVGSVMDLTERKRIEQDIADQRDREHDIAVRLQESLLPAAPVDDARVEIATAYVASAELLQVGGDWFETFHARDGRVGIVVGDVVGHNVEAAAAMGQLRAGLLALTAHVDTPAELLRDLDEFAQRNHITDFATALCVMLDPRDGTIEYSSAGHPPSLLCPPDGPARWLEGGRWGPLGVFEVGTRPTATDVLGPDDVLVAYSDGLVERRGGDLEEGFRLLADTVEHNRSATMQELCDRTLDALADGEGFQDDTVLVCLRLTS
jgi:PAS domain S-box-containing protein